ncbi:MAG: hypothetical protein AB7O59_14395 [Pirellulales bacterium]
MRTESSTVLMFRIFVMLSCLIIVPMAAIFGSAFPDVVKSVLVDRVVHWATGKAPGTPAAGAAGDFGSVRPPAANDPNRAVINHNASEAPRWGGADSAAAWPSAQPAMPPNQVLPAMPEAPGGNQQAAYVVPAEGNPQGRPADTVAAAAVLPGPVPDGAPGGAPSADLRSTLPPPPGPSPPGPLQPDPFTAMERKLRDCGATYYLLETLGNDGQLFRFHCKMAIGNNPNYTRHFEATDRDALRAMSQVVERVEAWRAGRPQ